MRLLGHTVCVYARACVSLYVVLKDRALIVSQLFYRKLKVKV